MKPSNRKDCNYHNTHNLIDWIHSIIIQVFVIKKSILCLIENVHKTEAQMVKQKSEKLNSFIVLLELSWTRSFPVKYDWGGYQKDMSHQVKG
jgi:hypothetical protein